MSQREDYAKEAYHDGKQAFRNGVGTNPFPWGCYEHAAWGQGYQNAQDLDRACKMVRMIEGNA